MTTRRPTPAEYRELYPDALPGVTEPVGDWAEREVEMRGQSPSLLDALTDPNGHDTADPEAWRPWTVDRGSWTMVLLLLALLASYLLACYFDPMSPVAAPQSHEVNR